MQLCAGSQEDICVSLDIDGFKSDIEQSPLVLASKDNISDLYAQYNDVMKELLTLVYI